VEVSGDKKSRRICFDISPLFFYLIPKLVQALVITYDEIYQALAVRDVLLPKPFVYRGHHRTSPTWPPRTFTCVANWENISEAGDFHLTTPSRSRSRNGFGSRTAPSIARAWKISSYVVTVAWTSLGTVWKNRGLMSKHIRVLFLCPLISIQLKKKGTYFPVPT
jgi:hypothetical protein